VVIKCIDPAYRPSFWVGLVPHTAQHRDVDAKLLVHRPVDVSDFAEIGLLGSKMWERPAHRLLQEQDLWCGRMADDGIVQETGGHRHILFVFSSKVCHSQVKEKLLKGRRVEFDEIILTGKAWVVEGALSSEAIVSRAAQGTLGVANSLLLTTGPIGDGQMAAQAALALRHGGVSGVIAPAFARPFFRVCLNIGLPPLTLWEAGEIRSGDRLRIDLNGQVVKNFSSGTRYPIRDLSELYVAILACGGIPGYVRALRTQPNPSPDPS
jgi:hypothetical protein